jgi:hypothetical protein
VEASLSKVQIDKNRDILNVSSKFFSYAAKHEKYPNGCLHKKFSNLISQSYMKICKTTFIFVNLDFVERLLEKKNENFVGQRSHFSI